MNSITVSQVRDRAQAAFEAGTIDRRFLGDVISATEDGCGWYLDGIDRELRWVGA